MRRTIVHDDQLDGWICLSEDTIYCLRKPFRFVGGHNERYKRLSLHNIARMMEEEELAPLIHLLVVGLVGSRGNIVKPLLILQIPTYCQLDTFLELEAGLPP